jgi:lipoprotein-releasing system permease protein
MPRIEARAQRLRSIDQWQPLEAELGRTAGIVDVSPMVTGPGFAVRGDASKSIAIVGIDPVRYSRIVAIGDKLVGGEFRVQAGEAVLGRDLAQDLGIGIGDRVGWSRPQRRDHGDTFTVTGIVDLGVRDLNRHCVMACARPEPAIAAWRRVAARSHRAELFDAEQSLKARGTTGLTVESG